MIENNYVNFHENAIDYLMKKDKHLAKVIEMVGPLKYKIVKDGYVFLLSQIIGQMLSNKVRDVMFARLKRLCTYNITVESISHLSDSEILSIGISHSKVDYIRNLTAAIKNDQIDFAKYQTMDDQAVMQSLKQIKGIGDWSAKMYLIFSLDRLNILPFEDVAFLEGYSWVYKTKDFHKQAVIKKCRKWSPYSSIAARYMYQALDTGLTKQPFHLHQPLK